MIDQGMGTRLTRAVFFCKLADASIAHRLSACPPDDAEIYRELQVRIRGVAATLQTILARAPAS